MAHLVPTSRYTVEQLFQSALHQGIGSGVAAAWGSFDQLLNQTEERIYQGHTAHGLNGAPVTESCFFDLASLTKILSTTTIFLRWVESGQIGIHQNLAELLPERVKLKPEWGSITIAQLLSHKSGLVAHREFFKNAYQHFGSSLCWTSSSERTKFVLDQVWAEALDRPIGASAVYSDLGFLILLEVIEVLSGQSLNEVFQREVLSVIPASRLHYRPVGAQGSSLREFVATEYDGARGGLLVGEVHDDNTWAMGGVSTHAGLFGRLEDVTIWARALIQGDFASHQVLKKFLAHQPSLGFDQVPQDGSGSTGAFFSDETFGHLGFTGTSLWIDPLQQRFAALLTNRVHPSRHDTRIRWLRRSFHELISC